METTEQTGLPVVEQAPVAGGFPTLTKGKGKKGKGKKGKGRKGEAPVLRKCVSAVFRHYDTYVKTTTAKGNSTADNGDKVAAKLRGLTLDEVYAFASKTLSLPQKDLRARYAKLNPGMQRMNLGNRCRAQLAPAE
jgi:hypothetical protein